MRRIVLLTLVLLGPVWLAQGCSAPQGVTPATAPETVATITPTAQVAEPGPTLGAGPLAGLSPKKDAFFLGSSQAEVLDAMGQPDGGSVATDDGGYPQLRWGNNMVGFDDAGNVEVFQDLNAQLAASGNKQKSPALSIGVTLAPGSSKSTIGFGSTMADVLDKAGMPSQAAWHADGTDLIYWSSKNLLQDSTFIFDSQGRLKEFSDDAGVLQ